MFKEYDEHKTAHRVLLFIPQAIGYTGHHLDCERNRYDAKKRYHNLMSLRWHKRDSLGGVTYSPNVYVYVGGNVFHVVVISGLSCQMKKTGVKALKKKFYLKTIIRRENLSIWMKNALICHKPIRTITSSQDSARG